MSRGKPGYFVLSVYPTSRGLAFVIFEGSESPYDWGVTEVKGPNKNKRTLSLIKKLLVRYRPDVLVVEDTSAAGSRRSMRVRRLHRLIAHLAATEHVDLHRYTRSDIVSCFSTIGALTKHEIAQAIAKHIPAFVHRIPRPRKPWMSEDPRQSLFDAAALGITHFANQISSPYLDGASA